MVRALPKRFKELKTKPINPLIYNFQNSIDVSDFALGSLLSEGEVAFDLLSLYASNHLNKQDIKERLLMLIVL